MADRGALYDTGTQALPVVQQAQAHGAPGLLPLYQMISARVMTQAYDNGFYAVGLLSAVGAALALLLHTRARPRRR